MSRNVALLSCLAVGALVGCGGGGGGGSTTYDAEATNACLSALPKTIVAPGEPVASGELLAVFFQDQTTGVSIFFGTNEDAAKQEYDKRARYLQNQPELRDKVLQQRENALLTWDRPASEKLRNSVLDCLREKAA
ncbi:MAG TPA: hypothetical protein VFL41_10350 [Gaiellaceae bacterium]|nr:hypothetical protein [Gaiellaceae bacterium]